MKTLTKLLAICILCIGVLAIPANAFAARSEVSIDTLTITITGPGVGRYEANSTGTKYSITGETASGNYDLAAVVPNWTGAAKSVYFNPVDSVKGTAEDPDIAYIALDGVSSVVNLSKLGIKPDAPIGTELYITKDAADTISVTYGGNYSQTLGMESEPTTYPDKVEVKDGTNLLYVIYCDFSDLTVNF